MGVHFGTLASGGLSRVDAMAFSRLLLHGLWHRVVHLRDHCGSLSLVIPEPDRHAVAITDLNMSLVHDDMVSKVVRVVGRFRFRFRRAG